MAMGWHGSHSIYMVLIEGMASAVGGVCGGGEPICRNEKADIDIPVSKHQGRVYTENRSGSPFTVEWQCRNGVADRWKIPVLKERIV